jgi:hypothetical protein
MVWDDSKRVLEEWLALLDERADARGDCEDQDTVATTLRMALVGCAVPTEGYQKLTRMAVEVDDHLGGGVWSAVSLADRGLDRPSPSWTTTRVHNRATRRVKGYPRQTYPPGRASSSYLTTNSTHAPLSS